MFARLTIMQGKVEKSDEAIKIYEDSVISAAKLQKGFKGAYLLTDRKTGKNISCTLWESEDDAVANEKTGYYQEQVDKFKDFITEPPVHEGYEVTVQVGA